MIDNLALILIVCLKRNEACKQKRNHGDIHGRICFPTSTNENSTQSQLKLSSQVGKKGDEHCSPPAITDRV